jgi:hypothetical protein
VSLSPPKSWRTLPETDIACPMRRRPSVAETVRIVNNPLDVVEASFHQRGAAFESF